RRSCSTSEERPDDGDDTGSADVRRREAQHGGAGGDDRVLAPPVAVEGRRGRVRTSAVDLDDEETAVREVLPEVAARHDAPSNVPDRELEVVRRDAGVDALESCPRLQR